MEFMSVQDAMAKGSGEVAVRGWVYRERGSNKVRFLVVRDATNIIQCVVDSTNPSFEDAKKLQIEASVEIKGEIKKDERAPTGYEIHVKELKVIGPSDSFPITKDQSPEFLLDNRHLWLRSRRLAAIMKVRHTVTGAIHEFFRKRGYYEFTPPIFTPNACEGGATLFTVNYFGKKMYLTQSWQLYAEAAVFALEKIYDVAPTFRAEKSKTSRHLAEFWMAEMEAAWLRLKDIIKIAEEEVKFIVKKVIEENRAELELLGRDLKRLEPTLEKAFPVITYSEALKMLKEKAGMEIKWGKDLRTIEEEELMKHFDTPVIVTNYPKEIMAFYKPRDPENPETALCFDMLAPEKYGEIIGGSERDTDIEELKKALEKQGEKIENYEWYLDLRRYGSVPHSGYGLGVERVIAWICGLDNIKDAIPFPRTMARMKP